MIGLIALMAFVVVAAGIFTAWALVEQRRAQGKLLQERLAAVQEAAQRHPSEELALLRNELLSDIPSLNRLLLRTPRIAALQKVLSQADLKMNPGRLLLLSGSAAIVGGWVTYMTLHSFLLAGLLAVAAASVPFFYVLFRRSRRFHKFEELFPEAIDLLARAVRAGHSFMTALELISNEIAAPVGPEFRKLFEEQKFGLPLRDALMNMVARIPLLDVKFFSTAIILQRETGGNLAEILDNLSYVIRQRFKILRQVRVYTAQGRLTLAILMVLPPGLMLMLGVLNPDFLHPMFTDPLGHFMIAAAIVMQTIGFFLIRKIIHIKV
jgi:tight adherence protein B